MKYSVGRLISIYSLRWWWPQMKLESKSSPIGQCNMQNAWQGTTGKIQISADQLSPVKTRNPLTSFTWPYRGLKFIAHRGRVFCWSWPLTKFWFFLIGSRVHDWLTCWKQYRIVRKPVNANPGLKVNWIITFSSIQMFLLLCFVYMVIIETQNRTPNKTQRKVTKFNLKFYFFLD